MNLLRSFTKELNRPPLGIDQDPDVSNFIMNILKSPNPYDNTIPCSMMHPGSGCAWAWALLHVKWWRSLWKLYLIAHL